MKTLIKLFILFLALSGASAILIQEYGVDFGSIDFWSQHGVFFLIFITIFPRLTLLLSSVVSGGFLWWVGWLFAPRILVAILATIGYWQTNPILVMISWLVALGGESSEKAVFINRGKPFSFQRTVIINGGRRSSHQDQQHAEIDGDTIEADFTVKSEKDT